MNVVNPNDTSHIIKFVPRYYSSDALVFSLYDETTQISEVVDNIYLTTNGITSLSFDYTFTENQKFRIKISDENGIVFRGKLLATSQTTQDFKLTNGLYFYE